MPAKRPWTIGSTKTREGYGDPGPCTSRDRLVTRHHSESFNGCSSHRPQSVDWNLPSASRKNTSLVDKEISMSLNMISTLVPCFHQPGVFVFLAQFKKILIWNSDLVFLIFLNFQEENVSPPHPNKTTTSWAVVYTEQGTSKSTSLPIANPPTTKLA